MVKILDDIMHPFKDQIAANLGRAKSTPAMSPDGTMRTIAFTGDNWVQASQAGGHLTTPQEQAGRSKK